MPRPDLKHVGTLAAVATLGLSAVFGLSASRGPQDAGPADAAATATAPDIHDMGRFVTAERVVNAEGEASVVAVLTAENRAAYLAGHPNPGGGMLGPLPRDLGALLQQRWGMTEERARSVATLAAFTGGPSAVPSAGGVSARGNVSQFCMVVNESASMHLRIGGVSDAGAVVADADLAEYADELGAFIRLHERAHCMGAGEGQADYVAAAIFLQDHPDPERAERAMQLMQDLRYVARVLYNDMYGAGDAHADTGTAVGQALADRARGRFEGLSTAQLWSLAKSNTVTIDPQVQADTQRLQAGCATAYAARDCRQMAMCVGVLASSTTGASRESYKRLGDALDALVARYGLAAPAMAEAQGPVTRGLG